MKKLCYSLALATGLCSMLGGAGWNVRKACAYDQHQVFFQNTEYELNVYRIHGEQPGKTMLIIGGIQGDEPGGYLAADLYVEMSLRKGNLIVVPRANFCSILLNVRGVNGDMNRKFAQVSPDDRDRLIIQKLKELIAESDVLLNLHDGSGFYHPEWKSEKRNPQRYGQSIIADCDRFESQKYHTAINVEEIARRVISNGLSVRSTRSEIYRLLTEASRIAQERGAAAGNAHRAAYVPLKRISMPGPGGAATEIVADEAMSVEVLAEQIARSDVPVAVLAVAVRNSVAGEPIQVELRPYRNRLVYRKDEEIARLRVWSGRSTGEMVNTLIEFLRDEVRARAIEAGIIPRVGADGEPSVGTVSNVELTDLADRIVREGRGRYVNVVVLADADTYSADSLRLRFRIVQ